MTISLSISISKTAQTQKEQNLPLQDCTAHRRADLLAAAFSELRYGNTDPHTPWIYPRQKFVEKVQTTQ